MKKVLVLLLGLGSMAAGLSYSASFGQRDQTGYLTAPAEIANVVTSVSASGGVDAVVTVDVSSQLSGQVEAVFVDFNDEVRKGQPLARLDQDGFEAAVQEAEANLAVAQVSVESKRAAVDRAVTSIETMKAEAKVFIAKTTKAKAEHENAKRDLERKEALREKNHISEADLDAARAKFESAQAELQQAKAEEIVQHEKIAMAENELQEAMVEVRSAMALVPQKEAALKQAKVELERSIIRSPIDGVVVLRDVEPGQTVAASLEAPTLFRIAQDLSHMEVHAKVDEADIGQVRAGQRASFTVDAFPGKSFNGVVAQVRKSPQVVQNVVIYTVIISTANPRLLLLPGMTALAEIVVHESGETLTVPSAALRFRPPENVTRRVVLSEPTSESQNPDGEYATVWVLDGAGQPTPITLTIGVSDSVITQVLDGPLTAGKHVIVGQTLVNEKPSFLGLRFGF